MPFLGDIDGIVLIVVLGRIFYEMRLEEGFHELIS